jgi:hypothetical protein
VKGRDVDARTRNVPDAAGLPLRELPRLAEIVRVAMVHGWGHYAERLGLAQATGSATGGVMQREEMMQRR